MATNKKTVSFSKKACNIFFHILTDCNLKCRHCYINKKLHGKKTLDIESIKAILSFFARKNKADNLILLGGEPTMHPDLHIAVKEACKLDYKSVTIDTNGYLFNDILSKVTSEQVDYFSFSLDGSRPETNDAIRGKNSFDKVCSGIKKTKDKGFNVSMIYTVSEENINDLINMPDLLKKIKPDKFFIQVIGLRGKSAEKSENLQVDKEKWYKIVPDVAKKIAKHGINVIYPKVYLKHDEIFECAGIVADNYFIFPNGRVYKCPLCEDFPINSLYFDAEKRLIKESGITEENLFNLKIEEGCVINRLVQPYNLQYDKNDKPLYKIACCMLKEETTAALL